MPRWESGINKGRINWGLCIGKIVKFIYDEIEGEILIHKNLKNSKIQVKYNDHEYTISTNNLIHCRIGILINKINSNHRLNVGENYKNAIRDVIILDRKTKARISKDGKKRNDKYYKIKCNKCDNIKWIEEFQLLSENNLYTCCSKSQTAVLGVNTIWDTDKWMISIVGEDIAKTYTRCSPKRVYYNCPDCGRKSNKTINIYNIYNHKGIVCSCGDGIKYPNKFMFALLEQLKVNFINEYSPKWIGKKKYDFYIPSINLIVEMDGGIGHGNKYNNLSKQTAKESKAIDDYKDEMAKKYNIKIIRINCAYTDITKRFNKIKQNILNSYLGEIFDLSKINWLKIDEFSLSNRCKEACKIKRENPNLTTGQIGKLMGHAKGTIRLWLIKGTELGWCNYNPEKEKHMSGKISALAKFKQTICLNNGMIFRSVKECSEKSLKLFGVQIPPSCIGEVCRGEKQKTHKIFIFKYIEDLTLEEYIKYDIENKLKDLNNQELVQAS